MVKNYRTTLSCGETPSGNPTATLIEPVASAPEMETTIEITEHADQSTTVDGVADYIRSDSSSKHFVFSGVQSSDGSFLRKNQDGGVSKNDEAGSRMNDKVNAAKSACNLLSSKAKFHMHP